MAVTVPWLGENNGVNTGLVHLYAGLRSIIDEGAQTQLLDVADLVVMVTHGNHLHPFIDTWGKHQLQPVVDRSSKGPGRHYGHLRLIAQLRQHFHRSRHGEESGAHRILEDLEKYGLGNIGFHAQAVFHGEVGYVLWKDAAVVVLFTGDTNKGFNRVSNDPVEIKTDFSG